MPRSGPPTYLYSLPAVYLAIPGTTITAQQHNDPLEDIADTFNSIQPIVWGGTGADTVEGAHDELGFLYQSWMSFTLATGTADALEVDPADDLLLHVTGVPMTFTAAAANTTAATLDVSGLGVKAIRKIIGGADVALVADDILAAGRYIVVYDSTANSAAGGWILVNPAPFSSGSWTPALAFGGLSTGITYSTQTGSYTKLNFSTGSIWFLTFNVVLTNKGSATGTATLGGFPVTVSSAESSMPKGADNFTGLTGAVFLSPQTSATNAQFKQSNATGSAVLTETSFTNTTQFNGMMIVRA